MLKELWQLTVRSIGKKMQYLKSTEKIIFSFISFLLFEFQSHDLVCFIYGVIKERKFGNILLNSVIEPSLYNL